MNDIMIIENLTNIEMITCNGGDDPCGPDATLNNFPAMDAGQSIGYAIGSFIGDTIHDFGEIMGALFGNN